MASFIGFAPADHPRFAAMVVLDQPAPQFQFGGTSAAPAWSEIMQFALLQYGVAPTDPTGEQFQNARAISKNQSCSVPHGADLANVLTHQGTGTASGPTPNTNGAADSLPADKSRRN